jgi:hypothetical protein
MSARATSTSQMVLSHQMGLEAAHYGNELNKDFASHQGGIHSALSAQEHSQTASLSAQEHNQRFKEDGANRRHEIKKLVLGHNNDLEKAAVEHHLSTGKLRTESSLRVRESNVAHKNSVDLISRVASAGEGGTPVSVTSGKASANFTLKSTPAPAAPVAPRPTKSFVGMPDNRASVPAPKAAQPTVKRAPNGRMVSMKETTPTAAPAKKATAKKSVAKGQPTVTRDPQTGRMIGIKKK